METKLLLERFFESFNNQDSEFLNYLTDDASWKLVGFQTLYGKESIEKFFLTNSLQLTILSVQNILADDRVGSVSGTAEVRTEFTETPRTVYFSHHYTFEEGKISSIVTFNHDLTTGLKPAERFSHLRALD